MSAYPPASQKEVCEKKFAKRSYEKYLSRTESEPRPIKAPKPQKPSQNRWAPQESPPPSVGSPPPAPDRGFRGPNTGQEKKFAKRSSQKEVCRKKQFSGQTAAKPLWLVPPPGGRAPPRFELAAFPAIAKRGRSSNGRHFSPNAQPKKPRPPLPYLKKSVPALILRYSIASSASKAILPDATERKISAGTLFLR